MQEYYLLDYLKQNFDLPLSKMDLLKNSLDQRIYYYGEHFKYPIEKVDNNENLLKAFLKNLYIRYLLLKNLKPTNDKLVISNAYFSFNSELEKQNINVSRPIHSVGKNKLIVGNLNLFRQFNKFNNKLNHSSFNQLLQKEFFNEIESFKTHLLNYYRKLNISSLIVPNDISFYELLNINIFKELQCPSFIFLHGLPARYNIYDDNQTDYLIVWGDKIKENYVNCGFNPKKIFVTGHPYYGKKMTKQLRNDLKNILIVTKSTNGDQFRDEVRLQDRGNLILYLYSIQNVLQKKGIKQVRFRTHPAENPEWYFKFIDTKFFKLDTLSLSKSLEQSSLVIGPTSTMFLESIYYNVNYLVYEPTKSCIDLVGFKPVPPFDGSDKRVPIANNENELFDLIADKAVVESSVFADYIQTPFDISFIKRII